MAQTLSFGGSEHEPAVRTLTDMKEVVYDQNWLSTAQDFPLYYMYRDLCKTDADKQTMVKHHLRYDITVIPPASLGQEFIKTAGHYHPLVPGTNLSYTEVYEVLEGQAVYLLQKLQSGTVTNAVAITAQTGDKLIIPPGYGHVTINPAETALKMANWVSRDFASSYDLYKKDAGGTHYLLSTGEWLANPNYENPPELKRISCKGYELFGFEKGQDMYELLRQPEYLEFLNRPQDFLELFPAVLKQ